MIDKVYKARKACWVYECRPCGVRKTFPDRFRAIEHQQRHTQDNITHAFCTVGTVVNQAIAGFVEVMDAFATAMSGARR